MSLRKTFVVSVIVAIAIMLFGGYAPSKLSTNTWLNANNIVADTANTPLESENKFVAKAGVKDCFPRYRKSAYVKNTYCLAQVDIGNVVVYRAAFLAQNEDHCSHIVSKKVRKVLRSKVFDNCVSGQLI